MISPMQIRSLEFKNPWFLAPLAGYTDAPFRKIATTWGAAVCVSEMVSAEGLARDSEKTEALLNRFDGEEKLIIQLFAPSLDPIQRALPRVMKYRPSMIDINCGCPVPKVVKTGAGSALMKRPEEVMKMVSFLVNETDVPISVKFRLGWDFSSLNYLDFAHACQSGGASMLTLHARTRSQGYSGTADWKHIKILKEEFEETDLKIFASGDIFSAKVALDVMAFSGCDGVMFARGAIGNPFIFKETEELAKGNVWSVSLDTRISTMLEHLDLMVSAFGEDVGCREMRKHAVAYVKGLKGASRAKQMINSARTRDEYRRVLDVLIEE